MKNKIISIILAICVFISPITVFAKNNKFEVTLEKCVDGDTAKFKLDDGKVYIARFLAIDTPETVHPKIGEEPFGKEASNYTCRALKNATSIELEYDANSDKTDKYNRLLVWIFVDNFLLQEQLIEKGLANVAYLYGNYKYTNVLQEKEQLAKSKQIGVHSQESIENSKETTEEVLTKDEKKTLDKLAKKVSKSIFKIIIDIIIEIINSILNIIVNAIKNVL